jgi:hypothetical protein
MKGVVSHPGVGFDVVRNLLDGYFALEKEAEPVGAAVSNHLLPSVFDNRSRLNAW